MTRSSSSLAAVRAVISRERHDRPGVSLGLTSLDDASTAPESVAEIDRDDETTKLYDDRQRQLFDCAARARDRLAAVRPALARLRNVLPRGHRAALNQHDLVELGTADVIRSLVQARRSVRALAAELAELESESREVLALVAGARR